MKLNLMHIQQIHNIHRQKIHTNRRRNKKFQKKKKENKRNKCCIIKWWWWLWFKCCNYNWYCKCRWCSTSNIYYTWHYSFVQWNGLCNWLSLLCKWWKLNYPCTKPGASSTLCFIFVLCFIVWIVKVYLIVD